MALLFVDSCDLYAAREQIARRWEPNATTISYLNVSATAGRWGGRAIQLASSGTGRIIRPIPPRQTVILAFAARFTRNENPVNQAFITLYDPTYTQVVIAIDFLEGRYRCYRGWFDTEIAQSAVDFAAVAKEQYHWFELKVTIADTGGAVELRRNGVTLLTLAGNTEGVPTGEITCYVASATPGHRDLYTVAPLGMTPLTIKGPAADGAGLKGRHRRPGPLPGPQVGHRDRGDATRLLRPVLGTRKRVIARPVGQRPVEPHHLRVQLEAVVAPAHAERKSDGRRPRRPRPRRRNTMAGSTSAISAATATILSRADASIPATICRAFGSSSPLARRESRSRRPGGQLAWLHRGSIHDPSGRDRAQKWKLTVTPATN